MSVTESDQEQAAATTSGERAGDGAPVPQLARARDDDDTPGTVSDDVTPGDGPWSLRAGAAIRNGASAAIAHPRDWEIWDQHPGSPRRITQRAARTPAWDAANAFTRWLTRLAWGLLIAWSALCCLLAVAPRSKTCWLLASAALVAWLIW